MQKIRSWLHWCSCFRRRHWRSWRKTCDNVRWIKISLGTSETHHGKIQQKCWAEWRSRKRTTHKNGESNRHRWNNGWSCRRNHVCKQVRPWHEQNFGHHYFGSCQFIFTGSFGKKNRQQQPESRVLCWAFHKRFVNLSWRISEDGSELALLGNRETILHSFKGTRRRKTWNTSLDQGFGEHEQPQDPQRMNDRNERLIKELISWFCNIL